MSTLEQDLVVSIVDALNDLEGAHPRTRAAHAKGVYCEATFTPAADAARLSRAAHFRGAPVTALVRFSNGSGSPHAHDSTRDGRGMAVKFDAGGGHAADIVGLTLPSFFVRTAEDFLEFVRARKPDVATGQPDMAKVGAFLGAHPEAMPAVQAVLAMQPPASYAQLTYNSIHAYWLVDADGARRAVRWRWTPDAGEASLDRDDAKQRAADYLRDELEARLADGPVGFTLWAVLAGADDPVDDPTVEWPPDRERVEMGRLQVTRMVDDPESDGSIVVFDPTRVTDGIELSGDRILHARAAAYSESVARRSR